MNSFFLLSLILVIAVPFILTFVLKRLFSTGRPERGGNQHPQGSDAGSYPMSDGQIWHQGASDPSHDAGSFDSGTGGDGGGSGGD